MSVAGWLPCCCCGRACRRTCCSLHPRDRTLFGTDASGGNLLSIDRSTGAGTVVGSTGVFPVPALAVDPTTGIMYAGQGAGGPNIFTVNPATGAATLVGDTGLGVAAVGGLDFRSDGTLFAAVNIVGDGGTGSETLATINKATGAATVIGPFGTEGMEGIAFDAAGRLWGSTSARGGGGSTPALYRIDPATGAATLVAPILSSSGTPPSGGVVSLQFACDGTLYGGTATGSRGRWRQADHDQPRDRSLQLRWVGQRDRRQQPRRVGVRRFPLPPNVEGPVQERRLADLRGVQEPGRLRQLRRDRREEPTGRQRASNVRWRLDSARRGCRPRSTQGTGLGRKECPMRKRRLIALLSRLRFSSVFPTDRSQTQSPCGGTPWTGTASDCIEVLENGLCSLQGISLDVRSGPSGGKIRSERSGGASKLECISEHGRGFGSGAATCLAVNGNAAVVGFTGTDG